MKVKTYELTNTIEVEELEAGIIIDYSIEAVDGKNAKLQMRSRVFIARISSDAPSTHHAQIDASRMVTVSTVESVHRNPE